MDAKPVVLVIEDSEDIRTFLRLLLQSSFTVVESYDGESGINLLESKNPDLVISDLMMPGLSGAALVSALLNKMPYNVPLLIISADRLLIERMQMEFPLVSFITKPFTPAELRSRISQLLRHQK